MLKRFLPDYRFKKVTEISRDVFIGADLLIFDLDNTLVFSGTSQTSREILDWFLTVKNRYRCILVSNNKNIFKRHKEISSLLGCRVFLSRHKKPFKKLFEEIKEEYRLKDGNKAVIVGDRVLTDVLFGHLHGFITILVQPINNKEHILVKIMRRAENI